MNKAKRLQPLPETLRELFLKSGNLCSFPGCAALMIDLQGVFIGQVCHIEAAEEGGERFNPKMTNDERRAFDNLMLMCYPHHKVTNDVPQYPVAKLREMKRDHERRFSDPSRSMLEKLIDWTLTDSPKSAKNLRGYNQVLHHGLPQEQLDQSVEELEDYVCRLRLVPVSLRSFLGKVAERAHRMRGTGAMVEGSYSTKVLISDVANAFQISGWKVAELANELSAYALAHVDQIDTDLGPKDVVAILHLESGWPVWADLVAFCEATSTGIEVFSEELDFARLDRPAD